jgi:ABC-2 type transport system ATP-binding protein
MSFGQNKVIDNLSFEIKRGETFGLLGSNGSGKTTIIRSLLGVYNPSSGKLLVDGQPFSVDGPIKLGYLPEERGLYKKETVIDIMTYFGQLKGMSRDDAYESSMKYLKRVDLADKAKTQLDKLSGGQQQKVQLGITVMGDPELLILDEPTNHLDLEMIEWLEKYLEKAKGTLFMVTHDRYFLDRVCNEIIELEDNTIYKYKGNYSYYVEKREERIQSMNA